MVGQDETLINGENTGVLIVKRGNKGAVIINVNQGGKSKVSFELNLPDGTYKDKANKLKYTVKDGVVTITVPRKKIAVIYQYLELIMENNEKIKELLEHNSL